MNKLLLSAVLVASSLAAMPSAFAANPALIEEGSYAADKPNGTWTKYYPGGQKAAEQQFDHGMRVGHWTKWGENGQPYEEGDYKNDKLDGTWMKYYPSGKKGAEQHYSEGLRVGHWSKWYENGQLAESGDYKNDKLDGTWLRYYPDGQLAVQSQYKNGVRDGVWKKWDDPQATDGKQHKASKLPDTPFDLDFEDHAPSSGQRR